MLALHRAGRSADALDHYRRLRERLVEELGTDPGTALQDLHQRILAADPDLVHPARRQRRPSRWACPGSCPPHHRHVHRPRDELADLDRAHRRRLDDGGAGPRRW